MSKRSQHNSRLHRDKVHLDMKSRGNAVIVRHTEPIFVEKVLTNQFRYTYVNPSRPVNGSWGFPWLSGIAANFDKYRCKKLHFSVQTGAPKTATGRYILSFDHDPIDRPSYVTDLKLEGFADSVSGHVYQDRILKLREKDLAAHGVLYTKRTNAVVPNEDLRVTDLGRLYISLTGDAVDTIFTIFAHYEFEFFVPTVALSQEVSAFHVHNGGAATPDAPYGGTPGNTPTPTSGDTANFRVEPDGIVFLKAGKYALDYLLTATQLDATTLPTYTVVDAATGTANAGGATTENLYPRVSNGAATDTQWSDYVTVLVGGVKLITSLASMVSNITNLHLNLTPDVPHNGLHAALRAYTAADPNQPHVLTCVEEEKDASSDGSVLAGEARALSTGSTAHTALSKMNDTVFDEFVEWQRVKRSEAYMNNLETSSTNSSIIPETRNLSSESK